MAHDSLCGRSDIAVEWPRLASEAVTVVEECPDYFKRPDDISDEQMAELLEPLKALTESFNRRSVERTRTLLKMLPPSEPVRTVLAE